MDYLIKTVNKNLIGNCTSEVLTTIVDSWYAVYSSQAVQVQRDPTFTRE